MLDPGAHAQPAADKKDLLKPLSRTQVYFGAATTTTWTTALNSANNTEGEKTNVALLRGLRVENSATGTNNKYGHPEDKRSDSLQVRNTAVRQNSTKQWSVSLLLPQNFGTAVQLCEEITFARLLAVVGVQA